MFPKWIEQYYNRFTSSWFWKIPDSSPQRTLHHWVLNKSHMNPSWHKCYQTQLSWHWLASYSITAVSQVSKDNKYGVQTKYQHASWVTSSQVDNSSTGVKCPQDYLRTHLRSGHSDHVRRWSGPHWWTCLLNWRPLWNKMKNGSRTCQSQQQLFLNTLSVSTDPTIDLVATISPDSLHTFSNFKSCWVRRNLTNFVKQLWQILNHWCCLVNWALHQNMKLFVSL